MFVVRSVWTFLRVSDPLTVTFERDLRGASDSSRSIFSEDVASSDTPYRSDHADQTAIGKQICFADRFCVFSPPLLRSRFSAARILPSRVAKVMNEHSLSRISTVTENFMMAVA